MGNVNASEDTKRYLDGYPGLEDDPNAKKNLKFYSNEIPSIPDGGLVEFIHEKWWGRYNWLEMHHGYIQWLFPIREHGLNSYAQPLQQHEAKAIAADSVLQGRVVRSYELMLDFYGMQIADKQSGKLARSASWQPRYDNLNSSFHNYLRITRILKCLGEVGLEHYKLPFVEHVLDEVYNKKQLTNCYESCCKYWAPVLRVPEEREKLIAYVKEMEEKGFKPRRRSYWDDDDDDLPNGRGFGSGRAGVTSARSQPGPSSASNSATSSSSPSSSSSAPHDQDAAMLAPTKDTKPGAPPKREIADDDELDEMADADSSDSGEEEEEEETEKTE